MAQALRKAEIPRPRLQTIQAPRNPVAPSTRLCVWAPPHGIPNLGQTGGCCLKTRILRFRNPVALFAAAAAAVAAVGRARRCWLLCDWQWWGRGSRWIVPAGACLV